MVKAYKNHNYNWIIWSNLNSYMYFITEWLTIDKTNPSEIHIINIHVAVPRHTKCNFCIIPIIFLADDVLHA